MAYEPLHHKYRPQTFGDLVGQEAIANTLVNAIEQEKIAPAYLFTGPRGTGKTSSARILAKSLNCLAVPKPTATPCGQCAVCQAIAVGTALDVIEIDAASNTGVDNIREIIERAKFAPVQSRYKVYAIDECHMLSTAAFNALLKTLEEPPPQVVFILATTDPQRVLSTIISRCQRFDYRRIPLGEMTRHLEYIAATEKIAIAKEAITLVAQIANGGLRDAESLLDQLSLFPDTITIDQVWDLVGAVPEQDLLGLLKSIRSKNLEHILEKCRNLLDRGREPLVVLQNLASFYLNLVIAKTSPQRNDLVAVTETCWQELQTEAAHWEIALILQGQQQLKDAEVQLKNTTQPRLWLEVTLLGLVSTQEGGTRKEEQGNKEKKQVRNDGIRENIVAQQPNSLPSQATESKTVAPSANSSTIAHTQEISVTESPVKEPVEVESISNAATVFQPQTSQPLPSKPIEPIAETETTSVAATSTTDINPDTIWQKAIALAQPPTTQTLLSQKCHLISINGSMVTIGVVSPPLIKLIQGKISNIETAFSQACQRKIKVTLEVAKKSSQQSDNNHSSSVASKPPSKPHSNGSDSSAKAEIAAIKTPENPPNIPTSNGHSVASTLPSSSPAIADPPPQIAKPVVAHETSRSHTETPKSNPTIATSKPPAITDTQIPIANGQLEHHNQDIIANPDNMPAVGEFQKAVELLAKSFDGEVIDLGNAEENSPLDETVAETAISNSLNSQNDQNQSREESTTTILNRPDLTAYEDDEDVPF
ncbi:DNA polymerase III, subunit gamma/tau [Xenococcus sp. PCC 7305]|uniref:DNA polymerase III subunit gamma/tau n=1 Tax=Xenococcus sp. PCC 7305 TaxID=102125 RepID=UPI0002ACA580|nr:DNA polymerase III subunit gamma/tau [Xenococcus sp. PCC 7305]ELS01442.1 DNA polymerase III, subunit gamma/tau [Xenococcus sp. PCC 7305]